MAVLKLNFDSYLKLVRDFIVTWIGYHLGFREILRHRKNANMSWNLDADLYERGIKHYRLLLNINDTLIPLEFGGSRVVELGPGGSLLNGFVFRRFGASNYCGVDAFGSDVFGSYPMELYKRFVNLEEMSPRRDLLMGDLATVGDSDGPIKYWADGGLDGALRRGIVSSGTVDFIYSYGVLEHVDDVKKLTQCCWNALKPGGKMVHLIEPYPHTWNRLRNPYNMLAVPEWLWKVVYFRIGFINRLRKSDFLSIFEGTGFKVLYCQDIERGDLGHLRAVKGMLPRFAEKNEDDLVVESFLVVMEKNTVEV